MQKKLIFISWSNVSEFIINRYLLDVFSRHFVVEYWNVQSLLFPDIGKEESPLFGQIRNITIDSLSSLCCHIDNEKNALYWIVLGYKYDTRNIWKCFHERKLRTFSFYYNDFIPIRLPLRRKVESILVNGVFQYAGLKIRQVAFAAMNRFCRFDGGNISISSSSRIPSRYHVNHPDYDEFLKTAAPCQGSKEPNRYLLFIDQNLARHSDFQKAGMVHVNDGRYHGSLLRFFEKLECKLGLPVVVAGHPSREDDDEAFGDRRVMSGCTRELIQGADGVLLHFSNAVSFAVLYDKPVLFFYNNEMAMLEFDEYVKQVARYFDVQAMNADMIPTDHLVTPTTIPAQRRQKYIDTFMCCHAEKDKDNETLIRDIMERESHAHNSSHWI